MPGVGGVIVFFANLDNPAYLYCAYYTSMGLLGALVVIFAADRARRLGTMAVLGVGAYAGP